MRYKEGEGHSEIRDILVNHRMIVGWGLRIGGWIVGVPSLAALVMVCASLFSPVPAADNSPYLDIGTYGIAGLLANGAHVVGSVCAWLGHLLRWMLEAIAVGLAATLLFAVALSLTGRSVLRHAPAARVAAIVFAGLFLLVWSVALVSLPRSAMAVSAIGVAASLYAIWVLGWRYT